MPWTNNASEKAHKSPKLHRKVSDYWHNHATLTRFFRARTYLVTARRHGVRAIDGIHTALTGRPRTPTPQTA